MKNLLVQYSGWFSVDIEDVELYDMKTDITKTAAKWLEEKGNLDGLILLSFREAEDKSLDGQFEQLNFTVEEVE